MTTTGSVGSQYLDRLGQPYQQVNSLTTAQYEWLIDKEIDAIVCDSPTLRFAASPYGRNKLVVVGQIAQPDKYGIAVQKDSPYSRADKSSAS